MAKPHSTSPPTTAQHVSHTLAWSIAAALLILLLGAVGVGAITYERAYADRIFPGVHVGSIDVGGLSEADAADRIQRVVDAFLTNRIAYTLDGRTVALQSVVTAPADPDLSYPLIDIDVHALAADAFAAGRSASLTGQWSTRTRGAFGDTVTVPLRATVYADRLSAALNENFASALVPMAPPRLIARSTELPIHWEITDGQSGRAIDIAATVRATEDRVRALDPAPIVIVTQTIEPSFTKANIAAHLPEIDVALSRAPLHLSSERKRWTIDASTIATWIAIDAQGNPMVRADALNAFIAPIAATIEQPARDARLAIDPTTKRVREFQSPQNGVRIDREVLADAITHALFGNAVPIIPIPVTEQRPTITLAETNDLGIHELLGRGTTSFAGSPANRRYNIGIGTSHLHGVIIPPGETFSTVGTVSPFIAENGYKPELVIKGDRTLPEFGGGLCQVSTTLFRTALASGLPIVERTNHAYRVPYYEPPVGMDATIYGPKPDFQFTNDTGHHILIRARVIGDTLEYELWGTRDGRTAETTEPEVFDFVSPPPTRIVETTDLAPGVKKCVERAHTGASARFTYRVTYPDGQQKEEVFSSRYKPWQAVCLVGIEPTAVPPPADTTTGPPSSETPTTAPAIPETPTLWLDPTVTQ